MRGTEPVFGVNHRYPNQNRIAVFARKPAMVFPIKNRIPIFL